MADQMHRTGRTADDGFKDRGFVRNIDIKIRAAFGGSAVSEQARRHTAEAVLPLRDDGPPGYAGATGSRHQHDRRTLSAFVIVDASAFILDPHVLAFPSLPLLLSPNCFASLRCLRIAANLACAIAPVPSPRERHQYRCGRYRCL